MTDQAKVLASTRSFVCPHVTESKAGNSVHGRGLCERYGCCDQELKEPPALVAKLKEPRLCVSPELVLYSDWKGFRYLKGPQCDELEVFAERKRQQFEPLAAGVQFFWVWLNKAETCYQCLEPVALIRQGNIYEAIVLEWCVILDSAYKLAYAVLGHFGKAA